MRQHYLRGLPFLVSKIYHFEVRCSFVAIKILLCRSRETKQGCRLARLSDKGIINFMRETNTSLGTLSQPTGSDFLCEKLKQKHLFIQVLSGAGGRGRTGTVSLPLDFESSTSANSITPASALHFGNKSIIHKIQDLSTSQSTFRCIFYFI